MQSHEVNLNSCDLEAARKKRLQHNIMLNTVHDIVSYLLYIILLTAAANASKDLQAYPFHRSLSDVFLARGQPVFEEVSCKLALLSCLFISLNLHITKTWNLRYTRDITPKHATSSGLHLRDLASGQHNSEET